jgi:hypothetical protein
MIFTESARTVWMFRVVVRARDCDLRIVLRSWTFIFDLKVFGMLKEKSDYLTREDVDGM